MKKKCGTNNYSNSIAQAVETIKNYVNSKSAVELCGLFDFKTAKKLSDAFDCELAFEQSSSLDKDTKERISDLAEYLWLKDESGTSRNQILDSLVSIVENGEKIDDLEDMSKWDLLDKVLSY